MFDSFIYKGDRYQIARRSHGWAIIGPDDEVLSVSYLVPCNHGVAIELMRIHTTAWERGCDFGEKQVRGQITKALGLWKEGLLNDANN